MSASTGSRVPLAPRFSHILTACTGRGRSRQGRTIDIPTGYAEFAREILRPPRSVAARTYTDLRRWTTMPKGGHFAAMEQPDALAREVQEFFRTLRG